MLTTLKLTERFAKSMKPYTYFDNSGLSLASEYRTRT